MPVSSSCSRATERKVLTACALAASMLAACTAARAVTPELAPVCESLADAAATDLRARIEAALKSRHPDHVSRLFSSDAAVKGFASPAVRGDYAGIRDYFLYFLQFEPSLAFEGRQIETGCNFAIDSGTYVWTLKPRDASSSEQYAVPTRYRMTFERVGGNWQISELIEEVKAPDQAATRFSVPSSQMQSTAIAASVPAVAGFVQRAEESPASAAISKPPRPAQSAPQAKDETPSTDDARGRAQWFDIAR